MTNHMFDHLIDSLEAEHKRGASAGAKKRAEKDQYGRKFMTDRDVERHVQALRVFKSWGGSTPLYNSDNSCIARILGTDPWFKQQGFVLQPDMSLMFEGAYNNSACERFFGAQADVEEDMVEFPAKYDGDILIGYDYRNWWDSDYIEDYDTGNVVERITGLLKAHGVEV